MGRDRWLKIGLLSLMFLALLLASSGSFSDRAQGQEAPATDGTPEVIPEVTESPTLEPTPTETPTVPPTESPTETPTETPPSPTATEPAPPTPTATQTVSPTLTPTPTATASPSPTVAVTVTATATSTATPRANRSFSALEVLPSASLTDLTFATKSYSHSSQTSTGTMTLTVDAGLISAGWNVTIQSSALAYSGTNGGASISASQLVLTSAATPVRVSGQTVDLTNGPKVPTSLTLPTNLSAARKTIQANLLAGIGVYTQQLGLSLTIPAQARAGTYTAQITVTTALGP